MINYIVNRANKRNSSTFHDIFMPLISASLLLLVFCMKSANATTYIVDNPSISDHGNASFPGTIASALKTCAQNGGGIVRVSTGVYAVYTGLQIGKNCSLIGSGMDATTVKMNGFWGNLITVASGTNSVRANWSLEGMTLQMPTTMITNFVTTVPLQANVGTIRNVRTVGGGTASWGLNLDGVLLVKVSDFQHNGEGNGIIFQNSLGLAYNVGDSVIENIDVILKNPNTTGVYIASPINSTKRVNNVLLSRVEVHTPDGIVRDGTVGIHLRNAARISLVNVDIENLDTGILQESAVSGGAVATTNGFLQTFLLGCKNDYVEVGAPPQRQAVIGGQGKLSDTQQLPSSNIMADHQIMGRNRVLTAVRPIVAHADIATPLTLTIADSGKVFTNKNASGTVTFILPPANQSYSVEYEFHLATTGNAIRVLPSPGDIIRPGQIAVSKYYESGIGYGQVLKIRNIDATIWSVLDVKGQWISEP